MKKWRKSFGFALAGILTALKTQRNMRIHVAAAALVLFLSHLLQITRIEWCLIIFAIGLVITAELINTAVEAAVDLSAQERHPLAGRAKDVAAGAVLAAALVSVFIGWLVFYPRLQPLIPAWR